MKNNIFEYLIIAFIVTIICGFASYIALATVFGKESTFNNCLPLFISWIALLVLESIALIFAWRKTLKNEKEELQSRLIAQLHLDKSIQSLSISNNKDKIIVNKNESESGNPGNKTIKTTVTIIRNK